MAGYTRQSVADIINGADITAPPLNAEFNQLAAAFNAATGHLHDGSAGNGPRINLQTSVSGYLLPQNGGVGGRNNVTAVTDPTIASDSGVGYAPGSIWINNLSGRKFVCLSNVPNSAIWSEVVLVTQGNRIVPFLTGTVDIGTSTFSFKNMHLTGAVFADSFLGRAVAIDTLTVSGGTTLTGLLTANGGATVNGVTLLNGNATVNGNTVLGDATTDTVTLNARIASDILPNTDDVRDLGSTTNEFRNLFIDGTANIDNLVADLVTVLSGTIDNTIIGSTAPQSVRGTTITATLGFVGNLTGAVTGPTTGLHTGNVVGDVTGNVTGNISSAGASTFNNVTIIGSLNMDLGSSGTVTGLSEPVQSSDAATKNYVDVRVSNLIDAAPGALDTLKELASALGNDQNFATSVYNSIATKLSLTGGTLTGTLAMSGQRITNVSNPSSAQDASTKSYVDTQDALKISKAGDTMSGLLSMGLNRITNLANPADNNDAANKGYVDAILGSATAASISASAALASQQSAASSEFNSAQSSSTANSHRLAAQAALASTQAVYDTFDDRYLGPKSTRPTTDNDGAALLQGALYWDAVENRLYGWTGTVWSQSSFSVDGAVASFNGREGAVVLNATDISNALTYVPASQADLSQFQISINASLQTTQNSVNSQITTLTNYVNTEIADVTTYVDGQISTLQTNVNTQLSAQGTAIQTQFAAQGASITAQLAAQNTSVQAAIGNIRDIERKFILPKGFSPFKGGSVVKSGAIFGGTFTVAQGESLYIASGSKLVFHNTSATTIEAENFLGFDTTLTSDKIFDGYLEVAPTVALTVNANVSLEVIELTDFR